MEFVINVYDGKTIEKTYKTKDCNLMMGTCEDLLNMIDFDKLTGNLDSDEDTFEIFKMVVSAVSKFKKIVQEIFPELTDEEYKRVPSKEIAGVVMGALQYTVGELFNVTSKN